jgi:hypothetical protein
MEDKNKLMEKLLEEIDKILYLEETFSESDILDKLIFVLEVEYDIQ